MSKRTNCLNVLLYSGCTLWPFIRSWEKITPLPKKLILAAVAATAAPPSVAAPLVDQWDKRVTSPFSRNAHHKVVKNWFDLKILAFIQMWSEFPRIRNAPPYPISLMIFSRQIFPILLSAFNFWCEWVSSSAMSVSSNCVIIKPISELATEFWILFFSGLGHVHVFLAFPEMKFCKENGRDFGWRL